MKSDVIRSGHSIEGYECRRAAHALKKRFALPRSRWAENLSKSVDPKYRPMTCVRIARKRKKTLEKYESPEPEQESDLLSDFFVKPT